MPINTDELARERELTPREAAAKKAIQKLGFTVISVKEQHTYTDGRNEEIDLLIRVKAENLRGLKHN